MPLILVLLAVGVVLLIGFAAGARFKEMNLRMRELQLAQGRRELRQTARAIQTHRELDWSLVPADVVVRHAVLPDGELLMVADSRGARDADRTELPEPRAALERDRAGAPE
jgi:hypothetical protein